LTHYWQSFIDIFRSPISYSAIEKGVILQVIWIAIFGSAAWAKFTTKDVLS